MRFWSVSINLRSVGHRVSLKLEMPFRSQLEVEGSTDYTLVKPDRMKPWLASE